MELEDLITVGLAALLVWLLFSRQGVTTPREEVISSIRYEGF